MTIERDELEGIADLARLELGAAEIEALVRECKAILEHFEAIHRVDVSQSGGVDGELPLLVREDAVECDVLKRSLAEIAPAWREGFFVLPRLPAMDAEPTGGDHRR